MITDSDSGVKCSQACAKHEKAQGYKLPFKEELKTIVLSHISCTSPQPMHTGYMSDDRNLIWSSLEFTQEFLSWLASLKEARQILFS